MLKRKKLIELETLKLIIADIECDLHNQDWESDFDKSSSNHGVN
jgi:hypothetical protein